MQKFCKEGPTWDILKRGGGGAATSSVRGNTGRQRLKKPRPPKCTPYHNTPSSIRMPEPRVHTGFGGTLHVEEFRNATQKIMTLEKIES